jgi:hypothetical protein
MKKLITLAASAAMLSAALVATPAPAQAGENCVTIREARQTLDPDNPVRNRTVIEREWGDTGIKGNRISKTMWRSYTPCLYPNRRDTWVDVVYAQNRNGVWRSIYWNWQLYYPDTMRLVTRSWSR